MTKHNSTVFLIKYIVIDLMISSPCVSNNPQCVFISAPFLFLRECVFLSVCFGPEGFAIRLCDEECVITVLLKAHWQITAMYMFDLDAKACED